MVDKKALNKKIIKLFERIDIKSSSLDSILNFLSISRSTFYRLIKSKRNLFKIAFCLKIKKHLRKIKPFFKEKEEKLFLLKEKIIEEYILFPILKENISNYSFDIANYLNKIY